MNNKKFRKSSSLVGLLFLLMIISLISCTNSKKPDISIITDELQGNAAVHGLTKLTDAISAKNLTFEKVRTLNEAIGKTVIVAGLSSGDGEVSKLIKGGNYSIPEVPEALTIRKIRVENKTVWLTAGYDDRGLMYALLDMAERIGWSSGQKSPMSEVQEITEKPDVSDRAVSLYTMNRAYWESRFYDEEYWSRYMDVLAKNRFNSMVVIFGYENGGFLAPCYPYFFNVEGFPDVRMGSITPREQERNLNALNRMIEMAHDRGIRFRVAIWDHIYRGGVQTGGIKDLEQDPNKFLPHLVVGVNGDNLISYTKAALSRFVELVPELDGIQFRMHAESGLKIEEQDAFWTDVFKNMKETAPDLQFDLRAKDLPLSVIRSAIDAGINFRITTKYWMEQLGLPFHPTHINRENQHDRRHSYADMLYYPKEYKMHWRSFNGGTTRILLWGDPEYGRRFAESTHLYDGEGFEINEPLATKMEAQPHDAKPFDLLNPQYRYYDYEFERYWHYFQVFGRMAYNPETSPDVWKKEFELRFGKKAAPIIEEALHQASWVLPRIVASCYPYGCFPTTRGWAEKQRLGDLDQYALAEGSDIQQFASFDEEAKILIEGGETAKILPSANSIWLENISMDINKLIEDARNTNDYEGNKELYSSVTDLGILSNLALFHSRRIPAAVSYRLFERTHDITALEEAIKYEKLAIEAWKLIIDAAGDVYTDDLMMGVREAEYMGIIHHQSGHWKDELGYLEEGLQKLETKRKEFNPESAVKPSPKFTKTPDVMDDEFFIINHSPVNISTLNTPITININITAPAGIKWVSLRYRSVNQTEDYQTLPMNSTGEKYLYQATIPVDHINPKFDLMYFIEMMDNNGNGRIYPDLNKETPYLIVKFER